MFRRIKSQEVFDSQIGKLYFPLEDKVMAPIIRAHGIWESDEVNWLKENVKPGFTCLNVGANVGYFACWMSRLTEATGKVIAVEPNPELIPLLKKNISNSQFKNVRILKAAAGEETTTTNLYFNRTNFGDSRVWDPRKTNGGGDYLSSGFTSKLETTKVKVLALDEFIDESIDIILLDTQGWDHKALRGMENILRRFHPLILTEFVPAWIKDLGENPQDVLSEFQSWGYKIGSSDLLLSGFPTADEILAKIEISEKFYTNLILS